MGTETFNVSAEIPFDVKREEYPFTLVENLILDDENTDIYDIAVYTALARFANREHGHSCWPKHETLCKLLKISETKLKAVLKHLKELKYIDIIVRPRPGQKHASNVYKLLVKLEASMPQRRKEVAENDSHKNNDRGHDTPPIEGTIKPHWGHDTPTELNQSEHELNRTDLSEQAFATVLLEAGLNPDSVEAEKLVDLALKEKASPDLLAEALHLLDEQRDKGVFVRNEFGWIVAKLRELLVQEKMYLERKKKKPYIGQRATKKRKTVDKYEGFYL